MSSGIYIYLKLEPYIRQWLINKNGGNVPLVFDKKSVENHILEIFLMKLPKGQKPDLPGDDKVAVELPYFKNKDIRVYNHLTKEAKGTLRACIKKRFIIELWNDLNSFGYIGRRKEDIIWAWMAMNGIENTETNFLAISKIYQRKRKLYNRNKGKND